MRAFIGTLCNIGPFMIRGLFVCVDYGAQVERKSEGRQADMQHVFYVCYAFDDLTLT